MGDKYNEVQPIRLGRDKTPKGNETSSNQDAQEASIWPPTLQSFVSRAFMRCNATLNDQQKQIFNQQLQFLVEKAFTTGMLWNNNWDNQMIPILDNVNVLELNCFSEPRPAEDLHVSVNKRKRQKSIDSDEKKKMRSERFGKDATPVMQNNINPSLSSSSSSVIVGLSQTLEKNYLRLTSEANPLNIRPQSVLEKSMKYVLNKFKENKSYSYLINQFKSIRQDLTVQHIKNDFSIRVYEVNALLSLENSDVGEFNQCQSQLKYLYYLKRKNDSRLKNEFYGREVEFIAYRLIYMIMMNNHAEINKIRLSFKKLQEYKKTDREKGFFSIIKKLFQINENRIEGNFYNFFVIIDEFRRNKEMTLGYMLMKNLVIHKEIIKSLLKLSKSNRKIPMQFLINVFKIDNKQSLIDIFATFELDAFIISNGNDFDCINSRSKLTTIINNTNFNKIDIKGQI